MEFGYYFKGKKVTVMRIGLLGRGIGDAAYMAEAGAEVLVVDDASAEVMQPAVDTLKEYTNITFKFGPYDNADFENRDFILVGAGAPFDLPCLLHAHEVGVPLMQSAALFAELSKIPIIGVTGTRGKSTVTGMIHYVLSQVTGEKILLGGNIRGVSNLQLLKEVHEDSVCVMELDSWQLQGFGWAEISPQVAVFTNFMEDHLNYYSKGGKSKEEAMELYFKDKAQIFLHQDESGTLVATPEVFEWIKKVFPNLHLGQEVKLTDASIIPEEALLSMPGEHNRLNAALAYQALEALRLSEEEIFAGLATFKGVEGRLQYVGVTEKGVRIYNDNNATTPQATAAGIKAVGMVEKKNVVLIAGGADKGIDSTPLTEAIFSFCKQVVLTPGTGTEALLEELNKSDFTDFLVVEDLKMAVEEAVLAAEAGDIILFSPAFASFAQYKNEYERNDEFLGLVNEFVSL
ncbi:MAG: UDP-N-acetylmuramoyl-L-alanine--D-glutamate ligase [Candidatus Nomurabacteria bacterium]|nr:UDP-N-acetylmuramoyl-L-alanine--D-glutamate ligase [Candidatus Nomurabacteria bacterium]USN88153.1 MAG: UDP-N-acetylmuramoyl-L-alanine--D-glutamate ligase [Candidatus Nomurabacteria bacterium]